MNKLTKWCIDKIKRDYPDDVALLIGVKGYSINKPTVINIKSGVGVSFAAFYMLFS